MKRKFSIAISLAVMLAMILTSLVLAADPPAHVVLTTDLPCSVGVLATYTDPNGVLHLLEGGSTPWTLDTLPSTSVSFTYHIPVVCAGVTYDSVSYIPGNPIISGAAGTTITVIGQFIPLDTTPPVWTVPADFSVPASGPAGAVVTYDAFASDPDGDGAVISQSCAPASGSTFPLGTSTVNCTATDTNGKIGMAQFNVTVVDTTPPTITFVSRLPAANAFGWNNTDVTLTWSCSDDVAVLLPTVTQVVSSEGSSLSATGTCADTSGNTASDTQTGINIDKTAPLLSPSVSPLPVVLNSNPALYIVSPGASDALSGIDTQGCTGVVDTSSIGSRTIPCTATDRAGNFNLASVSYTVQFATPGTKCKGVPGHEILQPIKADGSSVFKKGSTVPVKFRVCGADGKPIKKTPGVVKDFKLIQIISQGAVSNVDQAVLSTTPDDFFNSGNQQWIFNLSTKDLLADTTYVYLITLNDGSTIQFQFTLK